MHEQILIIFPPRKYFKDKEMCSVLSLQSAAIHVGGGVKMKKKERNP